MKFSCEKRFQRFVTLLFLCLSAGCNSGVNHVSDANKVPIPLSRSEILSYLSIHLLHNLGVKYLVPIILFT
jgi:hypothetical protein